MPRPLATTAALLVAFDANGLAYWGMGRAVSCSWRRVSSLHVSGLLGGMRRAVVLVLVLYSCCVVVLMVARPQSSALRGLRIWGPHSFWKSRPKCFGTECFGIRPIQLHDRTHRQIGQNNTQVSPPGTREAARTVTAREAGNARTALPCCPTVFVFRRSWIRAVTARRT